MKRIAQQQQEALSDMAQISANIQWFFLSLSPSLCVALS